MLNHTSSMIQLGQVLTESAQLLLTATQQGHTAPATSATELMLHYKLQEHPNAFLPPVGGVTKATGKQRPPLPSMIQQVRAPCSSSEDDLETRQPDLGRAAHPQLGLSSADACDVLEGAWKAAVAWLYEAANLGDVEAAAQLAWLWQRGEVLPADTTKADRLMDR
jgi:TPR repeat protein